MALFDWFNKKAAVSPLTQPPTSGLAHEDATLPMHPADLGHGRMPEQSHAANRKTERLERRELLYGVVRDSMTHVGVLSSSYKFKVLSLDSLGRQFLVMMDLSKQHVDALERLAEMESLIAKNAKTRHDILVTSVYWRIIEQVTVGLTHPGSTSFVVPAPASVPMPQPEPQVPVAAHVAAQEKPRFDPLQADEFAAFKQALASAAQTSAADGEVVRSGRRNPAPPADFQNTQIDEGPLPLSRTQYGDLN